MNEGRLPALAFATLVVATVAAFFVSQHLKVSNPLINGSPRPDPPAINPVSGRVCRDLAHQLVSFRRTRLNFLLQSRSDTVAVYMVDAAGEIVDTVGSRYMRVNRRYTFTWDGHETDGSVAPDGTYFFKLVLESENREFELTGQPVRVITTPPHPAVTRVSPAIVDEPGQPIRISYLPGRYRGADIVVYRTTGAGKPTPVKTFGVNGRRGTALWDGLIKGVPAPAGTYLVGIDVTDQACNTGRFPIVQPPVPGSTPHAGLTVRYLAAEPPLVPTPAGSLATVYVDSRRHAYAWALRRPGEQKVIERGSVSRKVAVAARGVLRLRVPAIGAGLYRLSLRSGAHRTVVPLIASAAGGAAAARVLVVIPSLSWQGANPVDDDGDGLPDTLLAGDRIDLSRPLVGGLPADFVEITSLLAYLDRHRLGFQLTTDLALAEGSGPALAGHTGVLLDGPFQWLPAALAGSLRSYVAGGGRVLSIGLGSLQATAVLGRGPGGLAVAGPPRSLAADPFGARHGPVQRTGGQLIAVIRDPLGIFRTTSGVFAGFDSFQPILPPAGGPVSLAGTTAAEPAVAAFRLGAGSVVEIGLGGFDQRLPGSLDAQALLGRAWHLLSGR